MDAQEQKNARRAQIIAVGNQKGGVGKTTNTVHLAAALGELGRRCLLIDLDSNDTATRHFGIEGEGFLGSLELLSGDESPETVVITESDEDVVLPPGVHLIPSRRKLSALDDILPEKLGKFYSLRDVLLNPLKSAMERYDYIFLDTAPNSDGATKAAYLAADWFILSAMPEPFAITGLTDALKDIQDAQRQINPSLRLLGVVIAGVDRRTNLSMSLIDYVQNAFVTADGSSAKFRTDISRTTAIPSAQKMGKTLFQTASDHPVTDQYRALAAEIEERLEWLLGMPVGTKPADIVKEVANG